MRARRVIVASVSVGVVGMVVVVGVGTVVGVGVGGAVRAGSSVMVAFGMGSFMCPLGVACKLLELPGGAFEAALPADELDLDPKRDR